MKYFFKSPEIYVKLTRSTQYPTVKDTPIVPIRGLWVAGIHRSIFDIDHHVTITNIDTSHAEVHDYTTSSEVIQDEGHSTIGIVKLNSGHLNPQKYTTSSDMIHDEGHSTIGIVCLNNRKVTANKYSTTQQTIEDEGHSTIGVVCLNGNYVEAEIYSESKYGNVCDSHGIFVSNITSSQATITDVNQNE
jgi:hypothetical protein